MENMRIYVGILSEVVFTTVFEILPCSSTSILTIGARMRKESACCIRFFATCEFKFITAKNLN